MPEIPLNLADFSWYGYDGLEAALREALGSLTIWTDPPTVRTVDDAIFVPATALTPIHFEGALLTASGGPIPEARQHRKRSRIGDLVLGDISSPAPSQPAQVIDEEVVYLGWYIEHFGHFLLESTARMWVLDQIDPATKVVFHVERPFRPDQPIARLLELFGVPHDRLLLLDAPTRLRRVIVPEPMYELSHRAHERMAEVHRGVARAMDEPFGTFDQPIYLSRRLLPPSYRRLVGEEVLEDILRENGFLVVYPETMSLEDQIRIVNSHRDVFSDAGTACYLSLFSLRPNRLHLLTDGVPILDFLLAPRAAGAEVNFCNCLVGGHDVTSSYRPLLINFETVITYLDSLGLLSQRRRAALAPGPVDLRREYDETDWYARIRHPVSTETLPPDVETTAIAAAHDSWAISWVLARYFLRREPQRVDGLVAQFAELAAVERDFDRLARYRDDVADFYARLTRQCAPATVAAARQVLSDRFGIDVDALEDEQVKRRRERRPGRAP